MKGYKNEFYLFVVGEGDAFGNLCLTAKRELHKSAVMLRCSCCVDIHILNVDDLKNVLNMFPEFSKNLKEKTRTILKKTVLTSQVRVKYGYNLHLAFLCGCC